MKSFDEILAQARVEVFEGRSSNKVCKTAGNLAARELFERITTSPLMRFDQQQMEYLMAFAETLDDLISEKWDNERDETGS